MEYFGTTLTSAGHYRFKIETTGLSEKGLRFTDLPFDPETLTNNLRFGDTAYYQGVGYTVFAISGSPADTRGGTKSVFWVKESISREHIIEQIKDNSYCNENYFRYAV